MSEALVLDRLFECLPDAVILSDASGHVLRVNARAEAQFGYAREELRGQLVDVLVPGALQGGADLQGRRKDGSSLPVEVTLTPVPTEAESFVFVVVREAGGRRETEVLLRGVTQALAWLTGEEFFGGLVMHLADSLHVEHAFVGERLAGVPERIATIAAWSAGSLAPRFEYALAGSPCEGLASVCCHAQGVRLAFPADRLLEQKGIDGFCGVPLVSPDGEPLGLLAVMHGGPLPHPKLAASILEVFGARAAAELERRRADRALHDSEEKYRLLFSQASDAVFITDAEGRFLDVNDAAGRLVGYSREELLAMGFADVVAPEELEREALHLPDLQAGRTVLNERRLRRKDGSLRFVEIAAKALPDGRLQGRARDITERRRAEQEVRVRSRQQEAVAELGQRALAEEDPQVVMDAAAETVARTLDAPLVEVLELAPEGVLRLRAGIGFGPGVVGSALLPSGAESHAGYALLAREPVVVEDLAAETRFRASPLLLEHQARSGLAVPIGSHGALGAHATTLGRFRRDDAPFLQAVANLIDASLERHRALQALRAGEERYRALVETASDVIFTLDLSGQLTSVNEAFERLTGRSRAELLGHPLREVVLPEQRLRADEALQDQLSRTEPATLELGIRPRDGGRAILEVRSRLILEAGVPVGIHGVGRDVTERKELEQRLYLSQKMEAIGRLTGGIAHDFNNLLTAIVGFADLALMRMGDDRSLRREVEQIRSAGLKAASLTQQLLAFSRKQILAPRVLDLNRVLGGMEGLLRRLIGEDVELVTVLDPALGRVQADESQLEQVLLNLAVNARDAMPGGGTLSIESRNAELDARYIEDHRVGRPGPYVLIAVSDTGHGMDEETRSHIFEPFFTTKEGKGTGLGLATVYGIVKQSGGLVWVYSEPGLGTTFKIYLPRVDAPAHLPGVAGAAAAPARGSETVLLVEDNDSVRAYAREVLAHHGYRVLEARNGEEALRLAEQHAEPIQLLLSDVVMKGLSGPQAAERIQALRPELRVLFMSGYTDVAIGHHGVVGPAPPLLQKPFTPAALLRRVREVLEG